MLYDWSSILYSFESYFFIHFFFFICILNGNDNKNLIRLIWKRFKNNV